MNLSASSDRIGVNIVLSHTYQGITIHHSTCPVYPLTCPNKCGASNIKRKDLADHRNKCPLELIECSFAEAGCTCGMRRHQLDNHIMSNQQEHLFTYDESISIDEEKSAKHRSQA